MNKNILICLEALDIGGVETYVYNQAITLKNMGYNVYIISKKGIYTSKLEEKGINCIEFEFEDKNYYDLEKIKKAEEIIKKYNITEVHINQFSAMNVMMFICIKLNIPYIVYLHMASGLIKDKELNAYNYYEVQYPSYKENLKLFFKYAYKIIAISKQIRDYTIERYKIDDKSKCIVIPNSINIEDYKENTSVNSINNITIISRFSNEKINSIINGIKLYQKIKEKKDSATLTIVGDGIEKIKIEDFIRDNNIEGVKFTGKTNNIVSVLEKTDLLIGIDRCVLEAVTMRRLSVISGYDEFKGLLNKEKIDIEIEENFCGGLLKNENIEDVANELLKLNKEEIQDIVRYNYKKVKEKLDIKSNVYTTNIEEYKYNIDIEEFIMLMINNNYFLGKKEEELKDKIEKNWQEHVEYQKWMEGRLEKEKEKVVNLQNELDKNTIYKIKNIFKK